MNPYYMKVEVKDGELEQVMSELEQARQTIFNCNEKLRMLGVVVIKKEEAASGNG